MTVYGKPSLNNHNSISVQEVTGNSGEERHSNRITSVDQGSRMLAICLDKWSSGKNLTDGFVKLWVDKTKTIYMSKVIYNIWLLQIITWFKKDKTHKKLSYLLPVKPGMHVQLAPHSPSLQTPSFKHWTSLLHCIGGYSHLIETYQTWNATFCVALPVPCVLNQEKKVFFIPRNHDLYVKMDNALRLQYNNYTKMKSRYDGNYHLALQSLYANSVVIPGMET